MKILEDLTQTTPEIGMKHYDRSQTTEQARQQQDLAAKEASYIQVVGYVPSTSISNQAWEDMVERNNRSKKYGHLYVQKADPGRNCNLF